MAKANATVTKTIKMDKDLAVAITTYSSGAGIGFSEGLRRLVRMGIASRNKSVFADPDADRYMQEIHRVERALTHEIEDARDDMIMAFNLAVQAADEYDLDEEEEI